MSCFRSLTVFFSRLAVKDSGGTHFIKSSAMLKKGREVGPNQDGAWQTARNNTNSADSKKHLNIMGWSRYKSDVLSSLFRVVMLSFAMSVTTWALACWSEILVLE